ncbi:MAG: mechanosensitive ion channel domain-containing protein [Halioglobus sp.]
MKGELGPLIAQLSNYGGLIASILVVMFGGMLAVFLLYRVANSMIQPGGKYARAMQVGFGALYVMVLLLTMLVAAQKIGLEVDGLAPVAILLVIVGATVVFFLLPFLPRLPFSTGDMVQIKDVMGIVEAMTTAQIVIRTFDGQTVFIPTPVALSSSVRNYSSIPNRRVELNVDIYAGNDIEQARSILLKLMSGNEHVLVEPAPAVYVTSVTGERASLVAYCWVENANWFGTRDALWVELSTVIAADDSLNLALPQMDISATH